MDNNDVNLVISDEELSNPASARSLQQSLTSGLSPKTDGKFLSTQELLGSGNKTDLLASNEKSIYSIYKDRSPDHSIADNQEELKPSPRYIQVTTSGGVNESEQGSG